MLQSKICNACGTQYPSHETLAICPVCSDDRQAVPLETGQIWTTHDRLLKTHSVQILALQEHVYQLEVIPKFAIGQRAFFILTDQGNILWDCIPLLDEATVAFIRAKGGLDAIAISHPHYYSNVKNWAQTFDCPVYIHEKDKQWIREEEERIHLWKTNQKSLWNGMQLINIGGHFPGSSILRVPFLSPKGTIFCSDTLFIAPSMKHISLIYSAPNRIPLPRAEVKRIKKRLDDIEFDTLYGFWKYQHLTKNVKDLLKVSFNRYLQ